MNKNYKRMDNENFEKYVDELSERLMEFIKNNKIKIDYVCPILRSGVVPATYIANRLNIVKFLPIQIKHITYNNGDKKLEIIFNPFNSISIKKREPTFLVVEAMHHTGRSAEICINEIKNRYENAKILYVCLAKMYDSKSFKGITIYEDSAFYYNGSNSFSKEKCKELNIEYYYPLFPWENLEVELNHPDDLEENIFF